MSDPSQQQPVSLSLWRRAKDWGASHFVVLHHAALLTIGPVLGAGLGFIFWWIAARTFDPTEVGLATAAISAMNVLALAASLSLGITYTGLHLSVMPNGHALVTAAIIASVLMAALAFVAGWGIAVLFHLDVLRTLGNMAGAELILAGAIAFTLTDLTSGALTGYLRNGLRMAKESLGPVIRISMLAGALLLAGMPRGYATLVIPGIAAELIGFLMVVAVIWFQTGHLWTRPDFAGLKSLIPTAISHHLLNLTSMGPPAVMPLLVAEAVSPAASAAFFPAWMILQIALLASAGASTALFALGVREPDQMGARLRFSLALSLFVSLAAGVVLLIILDPLLAFLNPEYPALAGSSLKFIGFGAIGMMLKQHYMAAMRFGGRMLQATPVLALGGLAELVGAGLGAYLNGSTGLVWGWLIGVHLLAGLTIPDLVRVTSDKVPLSLAKEGASSI